MLRGVLGVTSIDSEDFGARSWFAIAIYRSLAACCVILRLFLVVESFISLRKVPIEVYQTPDWTQWIPHFVVCCAEQRLRVSREGYAMSIWLTRRNEELIQQSRESRARIHWGGKVCVAHMSQTQRRVLGDNAADAQPRSMTRWVGDRYGALIVLTHNCFAITRPQYQRRAWHGREYAGSISSEETTLSPGTQVSEGYALPFLPTR
jgi:hypothetical protein